MLWTGIDELLLNERLSNTCVRLNETELTFVFRSMSSLIYMTYKGHMETITDFPDPMTHKVCNGNYDLMYIFLFVLIFGGCAGGAGVVVVVCVCMCALIDLN